MPPPVQGFASRLLLAPTLRTQPDRRLVALVRDGYESAFDEIVRRYGRPLARYAGAIVGSRAEDVTQDAFSKALLAMRRPDGAEIELRPWLFRIVRNTALNDLRDRPQAAEELAETIAGGQGPEEILEQREELADLMRRLGDLPESQRAAIVMRELEGLSHGEIAAALGVSGGAARQAIHRGRQAMRSGFGLLLPLPLLRFLADHGAEAAAAGAGGGAVATGGILSGAGAGGAVKAGAVAVVIAGSVGTGVAIQKERGGDDRASVSRSAPAAAIAAEPPSGSPATAPVGGGSEADDDRRGEDGGRDEGDDSDRRGPSSSRGRGRGRGRSGEGSDDAADDDSSGRGRGRGRGDEDRSGSSGGNSGPGGDQEDDLDDLDDDNSGPGSGTGSVELEDEDGSRVSGSGSGSSGSGSGGSSGSGSGDSDTSDSDASGSGSSGSGSDDDAFELDDD